jgi:hypothetical protein
MTSGEPDFQKRIKALTDLWYIKGVLLQDPTVAACLPISVENTALAYNSATDRFKVDIEAMTIGAISVTLANDMTRELGIVDLSYVLGAALAHDNPVIARLTDGSDFIDPRDVSDRAARLLGVVYGSLDKLQQRASTKELLVQLRHEGAEIDPTQIRDLTDTDIVTVVQDTAASLLAMVTQAEKDRTISSIDATGTPVQISISGLNGNSSALKTPAAGKALRLKFISLEHSADVDIGYRFTTTGTIHYLRITKGPYVSNLIGCNVEGGVNEAFYLYSSGATNVKGYFISTEV